MTPPTDQSTILRALAIHESHTRSFLGRSPTPTILSRLCGIVAARLLVARIGEVEATENDGPIVRELRNWAGEPIDDSGKPGPWCAYAVAGAHREAVRIVGNDLGLRLRLTSPTSGSTNRWWDKGVSRGIAVRASDWSTWQPPPMGAAILRVGDRHDRGGRERDEVWAGGDGDSGHTLMCALILRPSGEVPWIVSAEGNTSSSSQSRDGDGVWSHSYRLDHARLIGHVPLTVEVER